RDFPAQRFSSLVVFRARAERRLELGPDGPDAYFTIAGFRPVEKVGGRKETCDRLHGAALAIHGVFRIGIAGAALRAHGERQMSSGAAAGDAESVGIHTVRCRIEPHETHRAMDVLLDFRDGELRLRSMHDGKHSVSAIKQSAVESGADTVVARKKAAADHEQDG